MRTQNLASRRPARACADVAKSQPFNLGKLMYFSTPIRAIVSEGRTQAAVTSPWGRLPETTGLPISRTYRSLKWYREPSWFWHLARLLSLQPASPRPSKKKLSILMNRHQPFRLSRFTPVNTSKLSGRATGASRVLPARSCGIALIGGAA